MKRLFSILTIFLLICALTLPAFAADPGEAGEGESSSGSETEVLVPEVNVYNEVVVEDGEDLGTYVGTSVYALNPISPSDASGLKAVLLQFLGDWDSIVVEHQYENYNGSYNYVREIQLDYPWLCSAAILAIFIFCLFRLGGAILCKT